MSKRLYPPVWLILSIGLQLALHRWFPMAQLWETPISGFGAIPIISGALLILWAAGLFRKAGTNVVPFTESTALVTTGPYRLTRNPMYVGMLMILTGVAIGLGSATPFLALPLFFGLIRDLFVIPEEVQMKNTFGEAFERYCQRVRRWI